MTYNIAIGVVENPRAPYILKFMCVCIKVNKSSIFITYISTRFEHILAVENSLIVKCALAKYWDNTITDK